MEIRHLTPAEIPQGLELVRDVFLEFEAPDYPPEGVEEFFRFLDDPQQASLCFYRSITPGWCLKQRIPYVPAIIPWSLREGSAMGGSFLWRRSRRSKGIS